MAFYIAVFSLFIRFIRESDSINRLGTTRNEGTQNKRVNWCLGQESVDIRRNNRPPPPQYNSLRAVVSSASGLEKPLLAG